MSDPRGETPQPRHDPWKPGFRHSVDLRQTPEGHVWFCKWCRQDFPTWPDDALGCPGPDAFCPRCRSVVIEHKWSRFVDATGQHPWVCGRCYGDDHPQSEGLVVDPTGDESGSLAERLGGSAEPVKAAVARGAIPIDPRKAMGQSGRPS